MKYRQAARGGKKDRQVCRSAGRLIGKIGRKTIRKQSKQQIRQEYKNQGRKLANYATEVAEIQGEEASKSVAPPLQLKRLYFQGL